MRHRRHGPLLAAVSFVLGMALMGTDTLAQSAPGEWRLIVAPTGERLHLGLVGEGEIAACAYLVEMGGSRYGAVITAYDVMEDGGLWGQCSVDHAALGLPWPPADGLDLTVHALLLTTDGAALQLTRHVVQRLPLSAATEVLSAWEAAGMPPQPTDATPDVADDLLVRFIGVGGVFATVGEGLLPGYVPAAEGGGTAAVDGVACTCEAVGACHLCGPNYMIRLDGEDLAALQALWAIGAGVGSQPGR